MLYALSQPAKSAWSVVSIQAEPAHGSHDERARRDPRWQPLVARLELLRRRDRRALRIVDVNCGNGEFLIEAVRQARALGFMAIEALGTDRSVARIDEANGSGRFLADPGIGLDFTVADPLAQLEAEAEFPADIVFYEEPAIVTQAFQNAVRRAADLALRADPQEICG